MNDGTISTAPIAYNCPDGTSVTRSLHLARLTAGWSGCDHCPSRTDTEGLSAAAVSDLEFIRDHRSDGIVRTEFGIRGPYLNRVDRRTAARLTQVFCAGFAQAGVAETDLSTPKQVNLPSVIAGFDGRSSSPDVYVGVISAIREYGLDIIDVGRSTAASLTEATRAFPECAGAFLITGAGSPAAWTGMDVLDRHGDPAAVVWKDHGIRLQSLSSPITSASRLVVTLPDDPRQLGGSQRAARKSGFHSVTDFETRYQRWLRRWFPVNCHSVVALYTSDPLISDRVRLLAESAGFTAIIRAPGDTSAIPDGTLSIAIDEDDRQFSVRDSSGRQLSSPQLADRINHRIRSESPHITAHADAVSDRFWLTDAGRPTSAFATEQIRDALATLGLLLKLA